MIQVSGDTGGNANNGNTYGGNLKLSGTSTKTLGISTTVNGTLTMGGDATVALSLGSFTLTYGASATLQYAGTAQQTTAATEFPASGSAPNLKISNASGVLLGAARTITGTLTVDASANLNFNSQTLTAGATALNSSSALTMPVTRTGANTFTGSKLTQSAGTLSYAGSLTASLSSGGPVKQGESIPLFVSSGGFGGGFASVSGLTQSGLTRSVSQLTGGSGGNVTYTCDGTLTANAAADTTICNGDSYSLNGSGSAGSGTYSTFSWSPSTGLNNANIANPTASPTSTTTYTLTVTDSVGCTANKAVVVTVNQPPTTATVGGAQTICALGTTAGLGGNTPTIGTGSWSVVSGGTGTFSSATDTNATFTHLTGAGPVVLRWTIVNAPCTASTADVTVTLNTPVAGAASYTRNAGASIKDITVASLLAFASTPSGSIGLNTVGPTSVGGVSVAISGTKVLYKGALPSGGDTFSYTVTNGCGTVSSAGTVSIAAAGVSGQAGHITSVIGNAPPYSVSITFYGVNGTSYHVQRATDSGFTQSVTTSGTQTADGNGIINYTDSDAPAGGAYYRLVYP